MGMALAFTYFKSFGQCFAKAMVQRISILLLRRSRKLSKFRTPLRTPVAKTLYLVTIEQLLRTSQLFDSLCQPYKIVVSDKVSFWLNIFCHRLEKQVQRRGYKKLTYF